MKNKGKKKYLTFMALGLALTMLISSSITLAFFGASSSGTATIKMGNAVTVDHATVVESEPLYVSPSEMVDIDATATVKSPGDANSTTDALLRAKVTSSFSSANIAVVPTTTYGSNTAYWVKGYDGYYYLVETSGGDVCKTIETTTTGVDVPMQISVLIPSNLTNANGGAEYTVTVVFCAIQARIYDSTGVTPIVNTIKNTKPIFDQVEGTALKGTSLQRIVGNSVQNGTPTPNNPVEVQSVGERTGNLININAEQYIKYIQANDVVDWDTNKAYLGYARSGHARTDYVSSFSVEGTTVKFTSTTDWYGIAFPVKVDAGETYIVSWKTDSPTIIGGVTFYKDGLYVDNKNFSYSTRSYSFSVPADCDDVVVISFAPTGGNANTEISAYDIMLEKGSTATSYEPYGYKIPVTISNENLFNVSTISTGFVTAANGTLGEIANNANWSCSDYIKVSPNTEYTLTTPYYYSGSMGGLVYFKDKSVESAISGVSTQVQGSEVYTFTTPANCNYLRFSWQNSQGNNAYLEKGSYSTAKGIYNIYLDEPLRKVGDYADYIDFTTGQVVRQVKKSEINGNSSFGKFSNVTNYSAFYMDVADMVTYSQQGKVDLLVASNQFSYHTCGGANVNTCWTSAYQIGGSLASTYTRICFTLPNTITSTSNAKLWLKDNPVDIYYPLGTPISTDIDLSHIPHNSTALYGVATEVQPTIVVTEA